MASPLIRSFKAQSGFEKDQEWRAQGRFQRPRDVYRQCWTFLDTKEQAEAALDELV
jgi:hypothetical protein